MQNKLFLLLILLPCMAWAADTTGPGKDLSIYHINPWVDGTVLGVAAAGAAVPLFYEATLVHKQCPCDRDDVPAFDRPAIGNDSKLASNISHGVVALSIAVPIVLDVRDLGWNKPLAEDFVVYSQVLAINSALSNIARYSVQRPRPDVYKAGPPVTDPSEFLSFYSGHTASTVAALSAASMTYNYRYGPHVWPWVVTVSAGVGESALRIAAGRHFLSDNIVGFIAGMSVGTIVPYLHHRKDAMPDITLVPNRGGGEMVWTKKF